MTMTSTTKQTYRAMNIAKGCPARSNQLSAAAKQQPAENNKQRESDDGNDGVDGYTKQIRMSRVVCCFSLIVIGAQHANVHFHTALIKRFSHASLLKSGGRSDQS